MKKNLLALLMLLACLLVFGGCSQNEDSNRSPAVVKAPSRPKPKPPEPPPQNQVCSQGLVRKFFGEYKHEPLSQVISDCAEIENELGLSGRCVTENPDRFTKEAYDLSDLKAKCENARQSWSDLLKAGQEDGAHCETSQADDCVSCETLILQSRGFSDAVHLQSVSTSDYLKNSYRDMALNYCQSILETRGSRVPICIGWSRENQVTEIYNRSDIEKSCQAFKVVHGI